jgi:eukaryotic-like serine/threonine-protein kinase
MSLETGQVIEGKYRIVRLLGEGGMGAVYEGENTNIQRRVAIKVLHAGVASNTDVVSRFEKEAQAAGRIGSDHIAEVLDLGHLPSGERFMVMEFLDGVALSGRIEERGRLSGVEAAPIVAQLLEGLQAAHDAGIIHRDLKPDNVYLLRNKAGRKDFVKILDFGISKFNSLGGDSSAMSMTRTGAVMGTPYYMSPEQAKGSREIDARSDVYAVGVILYECICGKVPFNAETFNELIFKIVLENAPEVTTIVPDADPGIVAIVRKAMAREPAQRYQTAREFQEALFAWMSTGQVPLYEEASAAYPRQTLTSQAEGMRPFGSTDSGLTASDHALPAPKKSNAGIFVGVGVVALALLGGVAFLALRQPAGDAQTPAVTDPAAATQLPASASAAVPPAAVTTGQAEPAAAESATPPPVPVGSVAAEPASTHPGGGTPPPKGTAKTTADATPPATPPPPGPTSTPKPKSTGRVVRESL